VPVSKTGGCGFDACRSCHLILMDVMLKKLKVYKFFEQVKQEAKKISWLERRELIISVGVILVAVSVFSAAIMLVDYLVYNVIQFTLHLGR
jgi:preprotein translocase subunit SecE